MRKARADLRFFADRPMMQPSASDTAVERQMAIVSGVNVKLSVRPQRGKLPVVAANAGAAVLVC
jgi:hypothetical protein